MAEPITFRVFGTALDGAGAQSLAGERKLELRCAFGVHTQRAAAAASATVDVEPGKDIVALQIADGPLLLLHPEHARDLLGADGAATRGAGSAVAVTGQLPWTAGVARRDGRPGPAAALLEWFGVVRVPEKDEETAEAIAAAIDGQVTEGLYRVDADGLPAQFGPEHRVGGWDERADPGPLLVFMHGTFVDTARTFGRLWLRNAAPLEALLADYPNRAFAFDHPTILKSPIGNAIALVDSLPHGAVLHLVTHSRAGLVADVLLRASRLEADAVLERLFADAPAARRELEELRSRLRTKTITVQRVVRCACPARGTLLASRRLDAFLSVFQWLLGLAGVNATTEFVDLMAAVARQRTSASAMPGLQAMMPDSALVRWLNAPLDGVDSELYVVAGDAEGDGVVSWLKTLVADAFFWTDNDMVVQTRSMYGGVPRAAGPRAPKFRLFTGPQATHFSYFARPDLVAPLHAALRGEPGDDWKAIGAQSRAGLDSSGTRAVPEAAVPRSEPGHPHVIVVPDLFGSMLATPDGDVLWLAGHSLARFGELSPSLHPVLKPVGLVPGHYEDLCRHLAATHNVTAFAYDWRLDIAVQADALAAAIARLAAARQHPEQPIRIVAHGMGGLLVRAVQARHPAAWRHVAEAPAARIVLLGVPHGGSWLPLRMLCGDETFGRLFNAPGPLFQDRVVRDTLAAMPGFLQLQAGLADPHSPLREVAGWRAAAEAEERALGANGWHDPQGGWAIPDAPCLRQAAAFWRELEHALPGLLRDADKLVTVAGHAPGTVAGMEHGKCTGVDLITVDSGDRHVTLDSALLHGVPAWRMPVAHDALPRTTRHFDALADLLATGTTERLPALGGASRGGPAQAARAQRRPLSHGSRLGPEPDRAAPDGVVPMTAPAGDEAAGDDGRLTIRVHHGDLRFVKAPLLLGHYQSMTLSGTEAVVDTLVGGRMAKALRAGVYPDRLGSFQIFENGRQHHGGRRKQRMIPRPRAAIIVGLGEEGKLTAQRLAYTIRIGVLAFAERLTETGAPPARFELAAALAGSGGSGVSVGAAALALAQGITDANVRLREVGWPVVESLTIVEVYLDRATDAWRVLRLQAEATPERLVVEGYLQQGDGSLRRPLESSYRGAAYDFISATHMDGGTARMPLIAYSLDTRRARTEVRAQQAQGALVRDLVEGASNSARSDGQIGRTLFNLLIPVEIEPYLAGSASMLMELDATTSTLPWELLDTDPEQPGVRRDDMAPWAIRCKVIRKLRVSAYREQVVDAGTEDNMLIIGEPLADPAYGRLAGAQREAAAIAATARTAFGIHADRVTNLEPQANARRVINQLFARNYRIVHIAGHGTGPACADDGDKEYGGVVLSGKATYLGVNEIMAMRVTPELVFLNCCHLAQGSLKPPYDRAAFAAGIAGALIDIGVRCVIAAGWAIEDRAAELFATTFYEELFSGQRFIDAVGTARLAAWELDRTGNTWAAYQCYGDPDWSWKAASGSRYPPPQEEYAGVASPMTLNLVLQAIATEALYSPHEDTRRNRERLAWLEKNFEPEGWTARGDVAQEFGAAWAALPDRQEALKWLHRAINAPDGRSSLNAVEMLAEQASLPGATLEELQEAIGNLGKLVKELPPTLPRLSLLGNAYRRVSMLQHRAGDPAAAASLELARQHFERAVLCPPLENLHKYYPMRARLACEVRAGLLAEAAGTVPPPGRPTAQLMRDLAELAREIDLAANADPKFWSIVAQSEQDILKAVLQRDLAAHAADIAESMKDLYRRIRTKRYWTHVADDARALLEAYLAVLGAGQDEERQASQRVLELLDGFATTVAERT
ncbi:CHAT domain-containing protein [Massilia sp. METH4]|uniref:CHAT domain-containing protein n=1 Tax=Massilia sp. METH4 TaxID=3123041 RepID=UPI0030CC7A6B